MMMMMMMFALSSVHSSELSPQVGMKTKKAVWRNSTRHIEPTFKRRKKTVEVNLVSKIFTQHRRLNLGVSTFAPLPSSSSPSRPVWSQTFPTSTSARDGSRTHRSFSCEFSTPKTSMKFEVNEGTGTPEKTHPGKCRKVPFLLGNWIAGFRGFKWMEINSNCFSRIGHLCFLTRAAESSESFWKWKSPCIISISIYS